MGEEIKNLLEEEIKNEIENLASLEPGSEKHSTAVESLAKLYKVKLDEDKTSMEYLDKTQNRQRSVCQNWYCSRRACVAVDVLRILDAKGIQV